MTFLRRAPRTICPHCHHSVDTSRLEVLEITTHTNTQYRVCPECDEPIALSMPGDDKTQAPSGQKQETINADREKLPA